MTDDKSYCVKVNFVMCEQTLLVISTVLSMMFYVGNITENVDLVICGSSKLFMFSVV